MIRGQELQKECLNQIATVRNEIIHTGKMLPNFDDMKATWTYCKLAELQLRIEKLENQTE